MKKLLLFVLLLCGIFTTLPAQTYFSKKYSYLPAIKSGVENAQGYLLATTKNTGTAQLICLVQTNFNGDTLWTSTAGLDKKKYDPVYITKGGYYNGYIVAGTVYDSLNESQYSSSNTDIFIAQFDSSGKYMKMDIFGKPNSREILAQCITTMDGGLLLAGTISNSSINNSFGGGVLYCIKTTRVLSVYKTQWEKIYNTVYFRYGYGSVNTLAITSDGYIMTVNLTSSWASAAGLAKIDVNGNLQWSYPFGLYPYITMHNDFISESALSVIALSNKNYILIGNSSCGYPSPRPKPLYLIGLDSTGQPQWRKSYFDSLSYSSLWQVAPQVITKSDSSFSIVGTQNYNRGISFCFNSKGDSLGLKSYKYDKNAAENGFNGVLPDSKGGFLMYGGTGSSIANQNAWLLHTDSLCGDTAHAITTGIVKQREVIPNNLEVWPNPITAGILHIDGVKNTDTIEFYNLLGEKVMQTKAATTIDVSGLPKGMYFVKLQNVSGERVCKIIIQ